MAERRVYLGDLFLSDVDDNICDTWYTNGSFDKHSLADSVISHRDPATAVRENKINTRIINAQIMYTWNS